MDLRGERARSSLALSLLVSALIVGGLIAPPPAGAGTSASALAKQGLLKSSDFSSGWKVSTAPPNNPALVGKLMATCGGLPTKGLPQAVPYATSQKFSSTFGLYWAADYVAEYNSAKTATREFGIYAAGTTPGCMAQLLKSALPQSSPFKPSGLKITRASGARTKFPRSGQRAVAFTVTLDISTDPITSLHTEFISVLDGRAVANLVLGSPATPFKVSLAQHLAAVIAKRLG